MRATPVSLPTHIFLAHEADGNHQELEIEPIVSKPEKQVDTEDNRNRSKAQAVLATSGPGQQHIESIGKQQLADYQPGMVVHRTPVVAPVGIDAELHHRLNIVLGPQEDTEYPLFILVFRIHQQIGLPRE